MRQWKLLWSPVIQSIRSNCGMARHNCSFRMNTTKLALVFTWQNALTLVGVSVAITDCTFEADNTLLNIGPGTRSQSFIEVSGNDNATWVMVSVHRCAFNFRIKSGGCTVTVCSVVGFLDNVYQRDCERHFHRRNSNRFWRFNQLNLSHNAIDNSEHCHAKRFSREYRQEYCCRCGQFVY